MSLAAGQRLGSYEIISPIGAGGMGEVYRARDTKLNRDVAIKILPDLFSADPERLVRFTREAQTLAALNHPNIAHIYGVEDSGKTHALVMEFVDGEDLSQRIARGPIPLDEVLPIARQIADALEAAHEQGIVHRDLKPANIKVRPDGTVKVLDFGLAKAMSAAPDGAMSVGAEAGARGGLNAANSPTFSAHATQLGMILGTAAYMAPEQARGKTIDRRVDIWAFGAVLYEMLTGTRAFDGDEISDVLASVLKSDPAWAAIPADAPSSIRRLLRRCLEKDPRKRLSAIGDARFDLDERDTPVADVSGTAARRRSWQTYLWPALAGAVVAAWAVLWTRPAPVVSHRVTRLSMLSPAGASPFYPDTTGVAISPDGTKVAFVLGNVLESASQLWVRSLDSLDAHRLDGADGASLPFWSPDSRRLAFFTIDKLETIDASGGGRPQALCDVKNDRGGVWTPSNDILFAPDANGPIYRESADGGTPTPVTTLDASRKEFGHRFPTLLPDGDHFLYASLPGHDGLFDIFAGSVAHPGSRTRIGAMETAPVYADPGWLLFMREGVLTAQRFDAKALKLVGQPVPLDDVPSAILDPRFSYTAGHPVSVASNGSLAYFSQPSNNTKPIWIDDAGQMTGTLDVPPGHYDAAAIAPDGTHAVLVRSTAPSQSDLWVTDLARGGAVSLITAQGRNDAPVWSPDGARIVFDSDRHGFDDIYVKDVADGSPERLLYRSTVLFENPESWAPDGQSIVMTLLDSGTQQDIWRLDPATGQLSPLVRTPGKDFFGNVSPDGRSMLYVSDETGRAQLYVTTFPQPGLRVQVSTEGAFSAWWMPAGKQILYVTDDLRTLWRADVQPGSPIRVSASVRVATLPPNISFITAMPDRRRFLALVPERSGVGSITIVQNWRNALSGR